MQKTNYPVVTFRIPPELLKTLREAAAKERRTLSAEIILTLEKALKVQ